MVQYYTLAYNLPQMYIYGMLQKHGPVNSGNNLNKTDTIAN
jgi:hypothetical protein